MPRVMGNYLRAKSDGSFHFPHKRARREAHRCVKAAVRLPVASKSDLRSGRTSLTTFTCIITKLCDLKLSQQQQQEKTITRANWIIVIHEVCSCSFLLPKLNESLNHFTLHTSVCIIHTCCVWSWHIVNGNGNRGGQNNRNTWQHNGIQLNRLAIIFFALIQTVSERCYCNTALYQFVDCGLWCCCVGRLCKKIP